MDVNEFDISLLAEFVKKEKNLKIKISEMGKLFGLHGRNRSGKSTALRILAFLLGFRPIKLDKEINIELAEQFKNIRENLKMNLELRFNSNEFIVNYDPKKGLILEYNGGLVTDPDEIEGIISNYFDIYFIDRSSRSIIEISKILLSTIQKWMTYLREEAEALVLKVQNMVAEFSEINTNNEQITYLTEEKQKLGETIKTLEDQLENIIHDKEDLELLIELLQVNEDVENEDDLRKQLDTLNEHKKNYEEELSNIQRESFEKDIDVGESILLSQINTKEKLLKKKNNELKRVIDNLKKFKERNLENDRMINALSRKDIEDLIEYRDEIREGIENLQNEKFKCMKGILEKLDKALKSDAKCKKFLNDEVPGFQFFCYSCKKEYEQSFSDLETIVKNSINMITVKEAADVSKEEDYNETLNKVKDLIVDLENYSKLKKVVNEEERNIKELRGNLQTQTDQQDFIKSKNKELIEKLAIRIEDTIKTIANLEERIKSIKNLKKKHPNLEKKITDLKKKFNIKTKLINQDIQRSKLIKNEKDTERKLKNTQIELGRKLQSIKNLNNQNEKNKKELEKKGFTLEQVENFDPFFKYYGSIYTKILLFEAFLEKVTKANLENDIKTQKELEEILLYKEQIEAQEKEEANKRGRKKKVKIDEEKLYKSRLYNIFQEELDGFFNKILKEEIGKGWQEFKWGEIIKIDWRKKIINLKDYNTEKIIDLDFYQFSGGEDIISSIAAAFSRPIKQDTYRVLLIDEIGELDKENRGKLIKLLNNKISSKELGFAILVEPTDDPQVILERL